MAASDSEAYSSDSSSDVEESLAGQIVKKFAKSVFDKRDFLPDGCLNTLVTKNAVIRELEIKEPEEKSNPRLINFILNEGAKIFAIMLVAGFKGKELQRAIGHFRRSKLGDKNLPILEDAEDQVPAFWHPPKSPWDTPSIRRFCNEQWAFLAPVFSNECLSLDLHADDILPFTCQDDDMKSGAFGEVHQVTVHPSHDKTPVLTFDKQPANVAIKEIKQNHTEDKDKLRELQEQWKREVRAHIDIDTLHHQHIIEFIAAVTRAKHYLMFRWADGGNLRDFWQSNKKPQLGFSLVRDVVKQLLGLADALDKLHGYGGKGGSYRHGDIKPENILRVRTKSVVHPEIDLGVLKIADLGLAKHHNVGTEFRPQTSMKYTTYRYEPPEASPGVSTTLGRSRRQDIWSIGCVTLEFIIWLLYGYDALTEFNQKIVGEMKEASPYFEISGKGKNKTAKVHTAVSDTMEALLWDQECRVGENTAIKDLLSIVKKKLLVVNLSAATAKDQEAATNRLHDSQTQVGFRASARELCLALEDIIGKGEKNERYWYTGKPRSHIQSLPKIPSQAPESLLSPDSAYGQNIPTRQKQLTRPLSEESEESEITFVFPLGNQGLKARKIQTN